MTRALVVLPARFGSQRLPGKPLLNDTGKYLVQHVVERVSAARCAAEVVVATDDRRIVEAVESFGGTVVMTRRDHPSGTDRVAEVARTRDYDLVLNIQGDEPEILPEQVDALAEALAVEGTDMATLAVEVRDKQLYVDPNAVKVVCDRSMRALYFSRAPIPFSRDGNFEDVTFLKHIGVYGYRNAFLQELAGLEPTSLERTERLEQLRVLEHGGTIRVALTEVEPQGVDTAADYRRFVARYRKTR